MKQKPFLYQKYTIIIKCFVLCRKRAGVDHKHSLYITLSGFQPSGKVFEKEVG